VDRLLDELAEHLERHADLDRIWEIANGREDRPQSAELVSG
jgi:hypothetical protein